ncbi:hypothetical protein PT974_03978 [Cladobotryum mycophilum]|uniref:DUF6594 domain-containing protein n=1 Tax=Cladobotryum mycophilum TaxID=491253 RepID=A0ABR0SUY3_9HYPO
MAPHETGVGNGEGGAPRMDAPGLGPGPGPGSGPFYGPIHGPGGESNVKRRVRHARQASVDNYHEHPTDLQRTTSPLPPMAVQKKRKSVTISQKHLPEERKSSDTIDSRLSSPSSPLSEAVVSTVTATTEPEIPKEGEKIEHQGSQQPPHEEAGAPHVRERPRRGPRRGSPRRRLSPNRRFSPHQRPHAMDFMVGDPEEQGHFPPQPYGGPYQGRPMNDRRFDSRSPVHGSMVNGSMVNGSMVNEPPMEEHFDGHYPPPPGPNHSFNRFGSPEIPFHPEAGGFFSPPQGPPPFPAELPALPPLPALPAPERQLSGLELLAAKLSGSIVGPKLAPIYRRFESLHHRLLLHLQDELTQLESQLDELDTQDAHLKMYGSGPQGPRRKERNEQRDIAWRRNEILSQIAQKLYQYHQALASFKETQDLGEPTVPETFGYRNYLETFVPEVIEEYNFLEAPDLVSLARRKSITTDHQVDDPTMPLPRSVGVVGFPRQAARRQRSYARRAPTPQAPQAQPPAPTQTPLLYLVLAMAGVVLAPVLSFSVIRDFIGRMTVVLLIGLGGAAAMMQSGHFTALSEKRNPMDFVVCVGVYGVVMAIIAGTAS